MKESTLFKEIMTRNLKAVKISNLGYILMVTISSRKAISSAKTVQNRNRFVSRTLLRCKN